MRRAPYLSRAELQDYLKVGVFSGECAAIAKRTPEKDWAQKLKTVATYCARIAKERLEPLQREAFRFNPETGNLLVDTKGMPFIKDKAAFEALRAVKRRADNTDIRFCNMDDVRTKEASLQSETVTINNDDLVLMWQVIDFTCCSKCTKCGDKIKNCEIRESLHRTACPIYTNDPKDGCEFRWRSEANDLHLELKG